MERSIHGIKKTDRVRNTTLRSMTGVTDVGIKTARLEWDWAGHVSRMHPQRWARITTDWMFQDSRRRRGSSCSCGEPTNKTSWADLRTRLQESAKQRQLNRRCQCVDRRLKCLKIRRRSRQKERKVQTCTCTPHVCCGVLQSETCGGSPETPRSVCRFTVDAYFT